MVNTRVFLNVRILEEDYLREHLHELLDWYLSGFRYGGPLSMSRYYSARAFLVPYSWGAVVTYEEAEWDDEGLDLQPGPPRPEVVHEAHQGSPDVDEPAP